MGNVCMESFVFRDRFVINCLKRFVQAHDITLCYTPVIRWNVAPDAWNDNIHICTQTYILSANVKVEPLFIMISV